jgi:NADPH-dependent 2,4-dienoyl-CoA reductase/sulfur reductase-like enzyme
MPKAINPSRRRLLLLAGAALGSGALGGIAHFAHADSDGDDSDNHFEDSANTSFTLASTGLVARVVVVGGGMAGATAAKYLRLWGGSGVQVTLVEPNARYTSNIMSNLVLNGSRNIATLGYTYDSLAAKYGVTVKAARVTAIDSAARSLSLSDGSSLAYDRLILAPGVEFADAYGLTQADYATRTPHAWQAGAQTTLLASQLAAMQDGTFVMTIPKAPYRCPPGPYERACLVADYLKTYRGAGSRVIVLDENASIQAERETFTHAFGVTHAGVITYEAGVTNIAIDPLTRRVSYLDAVGAPRTIDAQVVSPIPPHRASGSAAGGWLAAAGLNNSADGRWCVVDVLSYQSTAVAGIHVIGDAASCGMPKAGHVANQEAKICADAIIRLLAGQQPDPAPAANSACYSPITATTASWLTAVYQYDSAGRKMVLAANGGNPVGATAIEAASVSNSNFRQMGTWFNTLMGDSFG